MKQPIMYYQFILASYCVWFDDEWLMTTTICCSDGVVT